MESPDLGRPVEVDVGVERLLGIGASGRGVAPDDLARVDAQHVAGPEEGDVLLGRGRAALATDRASRGVMALLEADLDTPRALRALEAAAREDPDTRTRASLRAIARVLGVSAA